jgi:catechol 2,3-dioxygenase-like lactoylglutathione lyase family enzyme
MTAWLAKDSIDIGIVTNDAEAAVGFYRDVLGFVDQGETPMPGGSMHKLLCGASVIKIVQPRKPTSASAPPGGIHGATGYRYWSIHITDIAAMVDKCEAAGRPVAVPVTELRPGVSIAIVEDPDGNWVEFVQGG